MVMQLKIVTKEEAHKLIDESVGDYVMLMTYSNTLGISDTGKRIRKRKGKKLVDNSSTVILKDNSPIVTIDLHDKLFNDLSEYKVSNIDNIKSILLAKQIRINVRNVC